MDWLGWFGQYVLPSLVAVILGYLTYRAQYRRDRHEFEIGEDKVEIERQQVRINGQRADQTAIDGLLRTLEYRDRQIKELQAQIDNINERREMDAAMRDQKYDDLKAQYDILNETLQRAVLRIDQLEQYERTYKKAIEYAGALERQLMKLGIDIGTIDATRVIQLGDWSADEEDCPEAPRFVDGEMVG